MAVSQYVFSDLWDKILDVCPITNLTVGDWADKGTWVVTYAPTATDPQKQAAQDLIAAFDAQADSDAIDARDQAIWGLSERRDLFTKVKRATPAQINNYIDNNLTTLADAKTLFKIIFLYLLSPSHNP